MQEETKQKEQQPKFQNLLMQVIFGLVAFVLFYSSQTRAGFSYLILAMSIGAVALPTIVALIVFFLFKQKSIVAFGLPFWLLTMFSILGNNGYSISDIKADESPEAAKASYDDCLLTGMRGVTGDGIKEVKRICRDKHLYLRELPIEDLSNLTGTGSVGNDGYFYATLTNNTSHWEISSVTVKFTLKANATEVGTSILTVFYTPKKIANLSSPEPLDFKKLRQDYVLTPSETEQLKSDSVVTAEDFNWSIIGASGRPMGKS